MHIDRLQLISGVKIDLVVVDYADLLRPFMQERNSNSYNEAGNVYEELRGMLGELQVPGWTASQANRGVHEENIIEAMGVADSRLIFSRHGFRMKRRRAAQAPSGRR